MESLCYNPDLKYYTNDEINDIFDEVINFIEKEDDEIKIKDKLVELCVKLEDSYDAVCAKNAFGKNGVHIIIFDFEDIFNNYSKNEIISMIKDYKNKVIEGKMSDETNKLFGFITRQ